MIPSGWMLSVNLRFLKQFDCKSMPCILPNRMLKIWTGDWTVMPFRLSESSKMSGWFGSSLSELKVKRLWLQSAKFSSSKVSKSVIDSWASSMFSKWVASRNGHDVTENVWINRMKSRCVFIYRFFVFQIFFSSVKIVQILLQFKYIFKNEEFCFY